MSPLGTQNLTNNSTVSNFPPAICVNDNKLGVYISIINILQYNRVSNEGSSGHYVEAEEEFSYFEHRRQTRCDQYLPQEN